MLSVFLFARFAHSLLKKRAELSVIDTVGQHRDAHDRICDEAQATDR